MNEDIEKLLHAPPDDFEVRLYFAERVLDQLEAGIKLAAQITNTFAVVLDDRLAEDDDFDVSTARARPRPLPLPPTDDLVRMLSEQLHALHRLHRETTKP